jgi:hypothetical protein
VQIDPQALRRHYASLADEELIALDPADLTEVARKCYDAEVANRKLESAHDAGTPDEVESPQVEMGYAVDPDWLSDAACATSFSELPGQTSGRDAAASALAVLEAAGIPCQIEEQEVNPPKDPQSYREYRLMVPGALNLLAFGVLDRDLFNSDFETEWRAHFEQLSDQELGALNPDVICVGLRDRILRLTRAYHDEVNRRMQDHE